MGRRDSTVPKSSHRPIATELSMFALHCNAKLRNQLNRPPASKEVQWLVQPIFSASLKKPLSTSSVRLLNRQPRLVLTTTLSL